jgi:ABC-2 type transport system permease protein
MNSVATSDERRASAAERVRGGSWRRIRALVRKETRQLLRDKSNIAVGILLPLMLIVIFGYGLSLDVKNVPVALVMEDASPAAMDFTSGIQLSPYFSPIVLSSMHEAEQLMLARKVDGVLRIRSDFSRHLAAGQAPVQLLVHGVDANRARIIQGYVQGAIGQWVAKRTADGAQPAQPTGSVAIESRVWFNEANNSTYFLVPGLIVLVMTLNGALLTALVMAREWERGTLEALFVTPVRSTEILLGKIVPYFGVGLIGLALCLLAAKFLFFVPLRGSVVILVLASMLYLLVALGIGLLISSAVKNQFLASQIALITSFLPALLLSGFLFDLHSVPLVVQWISRVLPATYFVELLQTLFLAGNVWPLILKDCAVLAFMAVLLLTLARAQTQKRLV